MLRKFKIAVGILTAMAACTSVFFWPMLLATAVLCDYWEAPFSGSPKFDKSAVLLFLFFRPEILCGNCLDDFSFAQRWSSNCSIFCDRYRCRNRNTRRRDSCRHSPSHSLRIWRRMPDSPRTFINPRRSLPVTFYLAQRFIASILCKPPWTSRKKHAA